MSETQLAKAGIDAIRIAFPRALPVRVQSSGEGRSKQVRVRNGWMQLAPAGTPDWLIVLPDSGSCWIEFKQPGEEPSDAQVKRHRQLRELGHLVYVVDDVAKAVVCVRDAIKRTKARAAQ